VPDAILQASIFFDMRPVHGDSGLFPELHHGILARAPQSRLFLAHTWPRPPPSTNLPWASSAASCWPRRGSTPTPLDIKRGGIGAVVELARVHALALGSPAVNTVARLQAAIAGGIMSEEKGGRPHRRPSSSSPTSGCGTRRPQVREGRPVDNHVNPDQLSSFDKRHLREAFAIVRSAQSAMASRYPTTFM
jgi:CBS domain-containing protein